MKMPKPSTLSDSPSVSSGYRLAWFLAGLCALGAVASPILNMVIWLGPEAFHAQPLQRFTGQADMSWFDFPIALGAAAITSVDALLMAYGLWRLRGFFLCSVTNRAFSIPALNGFRAFAWILVSLVIVRPIELAALSAFLSWCEPGEGGQVMVDLGTRDLVMLFFALVFVSVAHVLQQAVRQRDELDAFI